MECVFISVCAHGQIESLLDCLSVKSEVGRVKSEERREEEVQGQLPCNGKVHLPIRCQIWPNSLGRRQPNAVPSRPEISEIHMGLETLTSCFVISRI